MTRVVDGPTATAAAVDAVRQVLAGYHVPEPELRGLCSTIVARVAPILHAGWDAEQPPPVVLPAPSSDPDGTRPVGISLQQIADFESHWQRAVRADPRPTVDRHPNRNGTPAQEPAAPSTPNVVPVGFEGRATILHAWRNRYIVLAPSVRRVRGRERAQRVADRALARAAEAHLTLTEIRHLPDSTQRMGRSDG